MLMQILKLEDISSNICENQGAKPCLTHLQEGVNMSILLHKYHFGLFFFRGSIDLQCTYNKISILLAAVIDEFMPQFKFVTQVDNMNRTETDYFTEPWIKVFSTMAYLIGIPCSITGFVFVWYEISGLSGPYRTIINQLVSWVYLVVSQTFFLNKHLKN